jgi:hypothetical protein
MRLNSPKQKTYNTRVAWNGEVSLLLKGNFKWLSVRGKFGEICSKVKTQNLQFTANETRNRLLE